jgi:hypothetical protein
VATRPASITCVALPRRDWRRYEKRDDSETRIEALLVRLPHLKRATGNVKHLRGLPLGDVVGLQVAILCKQVSAVDAIPALVAIHIAMLQVMGYRSHNFPLILKPLSWEKCMAKDGKGDLLV